MGKGIFPLVFGGFQTHGTQSPAGRQDAQSVLLVKVTSAVRLSGSTQWQQVQLPIRGEDQAAALGWKVSAQGSNQACMHVFQQGVHCLACASIAVVQVVNVTQPAGKQIVYPAELNQLKVLCCDHISHPALGMAIVAH